MNIRVQTNTNKREYFWRRKKKPFFPSYILSATCGEHWDIRFLSLSHFFLHVGRELESERRIKTFHWILERGTLHLLVSFEQREPGGSETRSICLLSFFFFNIVSSIYPSRVHWSTIGSTLRNQPPRCSTFFSTSQSTHKVLISTRSLVDIKAFLVRAHLF